MLGRFIRYRKKYYDLEICKKIPKLNSNLPCFMINRYELGKIDSLFPPSEL